jgi:ribosomal protein S18 acetylase RimI-like enzyme
VASIVVRAMAPDDRVTLRAVFAHAGEGSPTSSLWGHPPSEAAVYLDPYIEHAPGSLFVAETDGQLVGYLTGRLPGEDLPSESSRIDRAIREHRLMLRAHPLGFFARGLVHTALAAVRREPTAGELDDPRWPAHLHLNVLPHVRGTGAADALMRRWTERMREHDVPGCHLQTLVENTRAVRFFRRMGFREHGPTPPVPGLLHRRQRVHQRTMVRDL